MEGRTYVATQMLVFKVPGDMYYTFIPAGTKTYTKDGVFGFDGYHVALTRADIQKLLEQGKVR